MNKEQKDCTIGLLKTQSFLNWLKTKLYLNTIANNAKKRIVKRGQVYWCNFGIGIGSEMSKDSPRPCVILQNDVGNLYSSNTIVAPITHDADIQPYLIPINTLKDNGGNIILDGQVNISNIVCISKARLEDSISILTTSEMKQVDIALAKSIGLIEYYSNLQNNLDDKLLYIKRIKKERNYAQDLLNVVKIQFNATSDEELLQKIKKIS